MDDTRSSKALNEFRANACEAISFKIIRTKADFEGGVEFHPEFAHQIFGESETIFGYRDLKVNIWYLAGSLSTYIGTTFAASIDPVTAKGVLPDDIYQLLSETFPYKFDRSLVDFFQTFHNDTFKPYGTIRHTYKKTIGSKQTKKFCVYFIEHGMPGFDSFLDYHKKMESFLLFFVDGASAIPTDDTQWCYYTLFEVIDPQQDGEAPSYAFIGYMTIFKFYAYPANLRPRLSQVLILPPFRNNGHATELLQTFYRDFVHVPNVRDITVEDPSDDFRRIRDFIDCKRCLEQTEIMDLLKQATANGSSLTIPQKSCYLAFRDKAQQCLKLSRCQAKRVYEILQLHQLPRSPEAVQLFRTALLKRVKSNYERATADQMHGRGADRRNTACGTQSLRNLIDEVADECYSLQINEFVDQEMSAYQCIVTKLDRHFGRTNVMNGPSTS
ncbi:hypothetical protein CRM22_011330 [Opisthorchis felineus]|uniref:histone acetyltransferase n=1 Tax=Opisthorchis felineus TaxID=147828 RepID=A0A4S2JMR4_OPIFE|nr:hypothetical protein CRM22_011330 [Opisthorchis felineus]